MIFITFCEKAEKVKYKRGKRVDFIKGMYHGAYKAYKSL
jgi:hypothetical protein